MSFIVKGIDLPKDGEGNGCRFLIVDCFGTVIDDVTGQIVAEAIQIPKDHGRLIDADALETVFKDMAKCEWNQKVFPISWAYAFEDTIDEIDNAPTILEAEE